MVRFGFWKINFIKWIKVEDNMSKCNSYHERSEYKYIFNALTGMPESSYLSTYGVCYGTKECDPCSCDGDETKCSFYPEKREKAIQANRQASENNVINYLLDMLEDEHMGMRVEAVKQIKERFGMEV